MISNSQLPFRTTKRIVFVGRQHFCHIRPNDTTASRHHATLAVNEDTITVHAMDTLNGTYLNGVLVQPGTEAEAHDGDVLMCGHTLYLLKLERDEENRATLVVSYAAESLAGDVEAQN
ncbi:MAG TPA: FHA domain-containing protein [Oculatellaceae cyanobacterium]